MKQDAFNFGDKLLYNSPQKEGLKTPCVFIRYDKNNGRSVIFFENAEWAARVNTNFLSRN